LSCGPLELLIQLSRQERPPNVRLWHAWRLLSGLGQPGKAIMTTWTT
jgi:hypothetical protein